MRPVPAPMLKITAAQRTMVEATLRRRDLTPRLRERLEMVKAAALGQDLDEIAAWSGRTRPTVRRWLTTFHTDGLAGLGDLSSAPPTPMQRVPAGASLALPRFIEVAVPPGAPPGTYQFFAALVKPGGVSYGVVSGAGLAAFELEAFTVVP